MFRHRLLAMVAFGVNFDATLKKPILISFEQPNPAAREEKAKIHLFLASLGWASTACLSARQG